MARKNSKSPYIRDPQRLTDVLAAIQAMGIYKFYKQTFADWADRISGDKGRADYWQAVFEEHPEFFRLDSQRERASLVWRRQYGKRYHVDEERLLSRAEFEALSDAQKSRVSRNPLQPDDIQALMSAAINLHSRAIEHEREQRWWLALSSAFGAIVGSLIGALVGSSAG